MSRRVDIRSERGQALVEFALVFPVFVAVMWGILSIGIAYGKVVDLQSTTREAARTASLLAESEEPGPTIEASFADTISLVDAEDVELDVSPAPIWDHGDEVTVTATTEISVDLIGIDVWTRDYTTEAETRVE